MISLLRAELRKILGRRLWWGLAAGGLAFAAVTLLLIPLLARVAPVSDTDSAAFDEILRSVRTPAGYLFAAQTAVNQSVLFWTILAAIVVGNEYTWGTLTTTLTLEPRRTRVLLVKVCAVALVSCAAVIAIWLVSLALTAAAQPLLDADVTSAHTGGWLASSALVLTRGLLAVIVWCAIATCLVVLTRSAAAAAGLGVGMVFADQFLSFVPSLQPALITPNMNALLAVGDVGASGMFGGGSSMPMWRAAVVLLVWCGVALAVAIPVFRRRDVT